MNSGENNSADSILRSIRDNVKILVELIQKLQDAPEIFGGTQDTPAFRESLAQLRISAQDLRSATLELLNQAESLELQGVQLALRRRLRRDFDSYEGMLLDADRACGRSLKDTPCPQLEPEVAPHNMSPIVWGFWGSAGNGTAYSQPSILSSSSLTASPQALPSGSYGDLRRALYSRLNWRFGLVIGGGLAGSLLGGPAVAMVGLKGSWMS
eukprot:RCo027596